MSYLLPERSSVVLTIFDIQGRQIKSYTFRAQSAGAHSVVWDGTNNFGNLVSSGIYINRVAVSPLKDGQRMSKSAKMMLLK
jgi:flagellar hook assembly protein FlgD